MIQIEQSTQIAGVQIVKLRAFGDERGRFMETFRKEWFPQRSWDEVQGNRSDSIKGTLRGLHYHHNQVDYWYVPKGMIRVGMVDLRPFSPTHMQTQTIDMGDENEIGLYIPIGVAHGFLALTNVIHTYVVDQYYRDGSDENAVVWNDPDIAIDWGITAPLISDRDMQNRLLRDIPADELPRQN